MSQFNNYYLAPREDVLEIVKDIKFTNVLDVGCAGGALGRALKEKGAKTVIGLEMEPKAAEIAKKNIDKAYLCYIENFEPHFKKDEFDLMVCADVIEHLKDPWAFIKKYSFFVSEGGYLVISVPNIRYYQNFINLIKGNWQYNDRGIYDKGHLRFFTLKNLRKLISDAGFEIIKTDRIYRLREPYCLHQDLAKYLSLYVFRDFFTFQFVVLAKKKHKR